MKSRVVVTGMGVISPVGTGLDTFWASLTSGSSGVSVLDRFDVSDYPTKIAAQVDDFDPLRFIDRKEAKRMDRFTQFAVAAAVMALEDAGLKVMEGEEERVGVTIGTGIGGMETLSDQFGVLYTKGPGRISPFFIPMLISNIAAGQIAIAVGAKGPNTTVVTACASATNAIGDAMRVIQRGEADVMITGGSEAALIPIAMAGFSSMKAMSTRNDEPEKASRPFDARRDGFVMGEGAGVLVLESLDHAQTRGARVYAEMVGYGMSADAYHITAPAPGGSGGAQAMRAALRDAGLKPEEVDYINAHGTSTPANDVSETQAIKAVFGDHAYRLAISSTKSMTGHLLGAAGAIELIACILAIRDGVIPPTINLEEPDPECDLDYVPNKARKARVDTVLSNSFGFGGQNACLLARRYVSG